MKTLLDEESLILDHSNYMLFFERLNDFFSSVDKIRVYDSTLNIKNSDFNERVILDGVKHHSFINNPLKYKNIEIQRNKYALKKGILRLNKDYSFLMIPEKTFAFINKEGALNLNTIYSDKTHSSIFLLD